MRYGDERGYNIFPKMMHSCIEYGVRQVGMGTWSLLKVYKQYVLQDVRGMIFIFIQKPVGAFTLNGNNIYYIVCYQI